MKNKALSQSKKNSMLSEIRKVLSEGVNKALEKIEKTNESLADNDNQEVFIKQALQPIAGMSPKEIASIVEPALSKNMMTEAEKVDANGIKKIVYNALTGLGITTALTSIVYTALLSSPQTGPIVEKIINGTLSPDASLIAGVIGIALGGLVASVGIDAKRGMKEGVQKTDEDINDMAKDILRRAQGDYAAENKLIAQSAQGDSEIQRRLTNRVGKLKTA